MMPNCFKSLLVAAFSLIMVIFSNTSSAQQGGNKDNQTDSQTSVQEATKKRSEKLDPAKIIMEHISDAHEFHFFTFGEKRISIPLPVILYSAGKGWSIFMSSAFQNGEEVHNGYRLLEDKFMEVQGLDTVKDAKGQHVYKAGKIYAADADGMPDAGIKVFDFSLSRNVVQTLISVLLLIWTMIRIAKLYAKGQGIKTAPKGFQNAIEPVITFIRDEAGKPNLGSNTDRFMPFLLTIFFFILINNLVGLIPGTANVSGNIAFTSFLGIISFFVIMFNTNKHYWSHIFNPPVPMGVKPIMVPVEIMGIFTKPFALIIRLFANMISGHIIILSFICLIFIFGEMNVGLGWGTSLFFILLAVFIYLIEILVAFIQAYIFAYLTALFIGMAMEKPHHGDNKNEQKGYDDAVMV
jgi:F-type H+-transporting ATPase subunit a